MSRGRVQSRRCCRSHDLATLKLGFPRSPVRPPPQFPVVEIRWKFCGTLALTGSCRNDMVVRFRGQSDSHLCEFAWTEFAPLRRNAIRSLTTRLNVPVVRERIRALV